MKNKVFIIGLFSLLLLIQNKPVYGKIYISVYYGYSWSFSEDNYKRDYSLFEPDWWIIEYYTSHLRNFSGIQLQFFNNSLRSGFALEFLLHKYQIKHYISIMGEGTPNPPRSSKFALIIFSYEFRILPDRKTRINPYLSVGLVYPLEIEWVVGRPDFIKDKDFKLGCGIRWRITDNIFINSNYFHFPKNEYNSARIGLDFTF